ncbi:hypothetical protein ARMGADRAFT_296187 [Armillaria gallica]|uniref:Uncharacterized protein n=1 Tax=Armillaria gallica TaxID=47427 RepID=A0A2H3DHK1_ARMGA|nr:hypothetical protein ARMGADRAFT_296187 [Armillaria gallica]
MRILVNHDIAHKAKQDLGPQAFRPLAPWHCCRSTRSSEILYPDLRRGFNMSV